MNKKLNGAVKNNQKFSDLINGGSLRQNVTDLVQIVKLLSSVFRRVRRSFYPRVIIICLASIHIERTNDVKGDKKQRTKVVTALFQQVGRSIKFEF
jgi:hypothetical protein